MSFLLGVIVGVLLGMLIVVVSIRFLRSRDQRLRQVSAGLIALCDDLEAKANAGELTCFITEVKFDTLSTLARRESPEPGQKTGEES